MPRRAGVPVPESAALSVAARAGCARLSLAQCRELLGPRVEIEEYELERVRDQLYALAEATLDAGRDLLPRLDERAG